MFITSLAQISSIASFERKDYRYPDPNQYLSLTYWQSCFLRQLPLEAQGPLRYQKEKKRVLGNQFEANVRCARCQRCFIRELDVFQVQVQSDRSDALIKTFPYEGIP